MSHSMGLARGYQDSVYSNVSGDCRHLHVLSTGRVLCVTDDLFLSCSEGTGRHPCSRRHLSGLHSGRKYAHNAGRYRGMAGSTIYRFLALVASTCIRTTILVSYLEVMWQKLFWCRFFCRFHPQVSNLQLNGIDLTTSQGTMMLVSAMTAIDHHRHRP